MPVLLAGCASTQRPKVSRSETPAALPVAIVVEQSVSGQVLGLPLHDPVGLAVDSRRQVYLADSENDRVIVFGDDLQPRSTVGGFGHQAGLLDNPLYITIGQNDNLWIVDYNNRRICQFTNRHLVLDCIDLVDEDDPLLIGRPISMIVNAYGEVWLTDEGNNQIVLLDNQGRFDKVIGDASYPGGQLRGPAKLVTAPSGDIVVCDAGRSRLMVYDDSGNFEREIADVSMVEPVAAAFDEQGLWWVLDRSTAQVYCLDDEGAWVGSFGPVLSGDSRALSTPKDLVFDDEGRLLIVDSGNNRLLACRVYYDQDTSSN